MKEKIVIKIWTNALMSKSGWLNKKLIADLAYQINKIKNTYEKEIVIVSSWAVWLWKNKFSSELKLKMNKTQEKQFFAAIWQPYLMQEYQKIFDYYDITVAQALLTRSDFAHRDKYLSMQEILTQLLENWIIPIINENDVLSPEELDFSDNDQLSAYVAWMIWAEKLIILSDVAGLYTAHPSKPWAQKIDIVNEINETIMNYADSEKSSQWTWWMLSKIQTAKLVTNLWIHMHIAHSNENNVLIRILEWENVWTRFESKSNKKISWIRKWLNTWAVPQWKIYVSTIISDLLKKWKRSSILAIWIERFEWVFHEKDVLEVLDENWVSLWFGITKLSSEKLYEQIHQDRENQKNIIVIHTDYYLSN